MRKSVLPAPTSMPPTAIGRTMNFQTATFIPPQDDSAAPGGSRSLSCGPRK
jgi:hypothetical protein